MTIRRFFCLATVVTIPVTLSAQVITPKLYEELRWRCIGPFRAGRTVGAAGIANQPNVFYMGVNNGGVWKTTDYGRTWTPIFDEQPTGSIGDIAVAPSDPNTIYVGSGEGLQRPDLSVGDGVYRSTDAGKTWRNVGLRDAQQIGGIAIDPRDARRVYVAALGHPYGPNTERGVFRTLDGGDSWQKVLYKNENAGAVQVEVDPKTPDNVYAVLWESRQGPWENGAWQGPGSGLFKSTDGGATWKQLTNGLPTSQQGLGRIGLGISASNPSIIYAVVDAPQIGGVYRTDDGGESWRRITSDPRTWGRGSDFAEIRVNPQNPEIVYVGNVGSYRSTDGGKTFTAFKGAPGGDDYHRVWINPLNPDIMLFAVDQGAIVTVNGGQTWSSWYNQPTAQFYHVITDNRFPYWVYGGQQESGSAAVASRGDYGAITWRDWRTIGVEEYGYVAPDPLNSNNIYGGKITRYDWTTGQVQNVSPDAGRGGGHRFLRTAPVIFSPVDPHALYLAGNVVFRTRNGGQSWDVISPDLSREHPEVPVSIGVYRTSEMAQMPRRGVVYSLAPSYRDRNLIWAGTDDGLIHVTRDGGKSWQNVTPIDLNPWSKVSIIESGHFDSATAYAAINRLRLDDLHPHIYRTHNGGRTWQEIVRGIAQADVVNAVREDPVRRGLLFASTERAVYVSFNDGDDWLPLRQNMPATSVRDIVIHGDDLVAGTHGRSFWILDDITPLRQITSQTAAADAVLFKPQIAVRVRRSINTDTPIPGDEPMGQNPPDGAIINYFLKADAPEVVLEILDKSGRVVRRFSSLDKPEQVDENQLTYPMYWVRPPRVLSTKAGMHRFVWDLHYPPLEGGARTFPISAIMHDTPTVPLGPSALPGVYTARLTVNGRTQSEQLTLKMDPRVSAPQEVIARMFEISIKSYDGARQARELGVQVRTLRNQLQQRRGQAGQGNVATAIAELEAKAAALEGAGGGRGFGRRGGRGGAPATGESATFASVAGELNSVMGLVETADASPTTQAVAAFDAAQTSLKGLISRWSDLKRRDIPALNERLRQSNIAPINP